MKTCLFYFGPFGEDSINSSEEVAVLVEESLSGTVNKRHRLPVSFKRSVRLAAEIIDRESPDFILCLGQAAGRATINLERIAINFAQAKDRDRDGYFPSGEKLIADGPVACHTNVRVDDLAEHLRAMGMPCFVSNSAGTFVCNCLYYNLLFLYPEKRILFVHLPLTPRQSACRTITTPSLPPEFVAKVLIEILDVVADGYYL